MGAMWGVGDGRAVDGVVSQMAFFVLGFGCGVGDQRGSFKGSLHARSGL